LCTGAGCEYKQHMSPGHLRYLLLEQGVGAGVVNLVLNGVIAWALFRGVAVVPLWGTQSIAGDTIGTTFFLPFLTCLIVTRIVRRHMRTRQLGTLGWTRESHPPLGWLPVGTVRRGLMLGLVCAVGVGPPTVWTLSHLGVSTMPLWGFITFKATFAAVLAALVTPIIALWALAGVTES